VLLFMDKRFPSVVGRFPVYSNHTDALIQCIVCSKSKHTGHPWPYAGMCSCWAAAPDTHRRRPALTIFFFFFFLNYSSDAFNPSQTAIIGLQMP
jgi:hypothetical protein